MERQIPPTPTPFDPYRQYEYFAPPRHGPEGEWPDDPAVLPLVEHVRQELAQRLGRPRPPQGAASPLGWIAPAGPSGPTGPWGSVGPGPRYPPAPPPQARGGVVGAPVPPSTPPSARASRPSPAPGTET